MAIYQYIYNAALRFLLLTGNRPGRFTNFKAGVLIAFTEAWLLFSAFAWVNILFGVNLILAGHRVVLLFVIVAAVCINRMLRGTSEMRTKYEQMYLSWPTARRRICDMAVLLFVLGSVVLGLYSAIRLRGHVLSSV